MSSEQEFTGLGFAPGIVRGVRSFDVDKYGRLTGIHYQQVWTPGENVAECKAEERNAWASGSIGGAWHRAYTSLFTTYPSSGQFIFATSTPAPEVIKLPANVSKYIDAPAEIEPITNYEPVKPKHAFEDCRCGFYGYFDGSDDYHGHGKVTAVVEAFGETVIGTRGFRAMKARIVALRIRADHDGVTPAMARKIQTNYPAVPIFQKFKAMVAEFPPDTSLEPSPESDPDFWTRT